MCEREKVRGRACAREREIFIYIERGIERDLRWFRIEGRERESRCVCASERERVRARKRER